MRTAGAYPIPLVAKKLTSAEVDGDDKHSNLFRLSVIEEGNAL
jgi:hypothetical protein